MKNKIELKKALIINCIICIIGIAIFLVVNYFEFREYNANYNLKLEQIISNITEKYPDISELELIQILNSDSINTKHILQKYGIDIQKESALLSNNKTFNYYIVLESGVLVLIIISLASVFLIYNNNKDKKLKEITRYIEEINRKNYKLDIEDNTEDELSILKNEIYKTTIMLKEQAENSMKDKSKLKDSLSDISHQLKTPLTSIIILLDNIIDEPNMDKNTRNDFIKDIRREIININFLVQALLKLSKFDANVVEYVNKEEKVSAVVNEAVSKVAAFADLKNIKLEIVGNEKNTIFCDLKWQAEAIANILKNSIEYSENGSSVRVEYAKNKAYVEMKIIDSGKGIDEEDLKNIFKRFYKGKNSSRESIGIGLALAKTIVEKNNGNIEVSSILGKGTEFKIKYFKI